MLNPSILNIFLFWFVKYVLFYILQMFRSGNYALIEFGELKSSEDWYYYLWLFLFMPVICMLIFTTPVYLSFKSKGQSTQLLILLAVLIAEYFIYTYLASPADLWNGVYNGLIGISVFMFFFYKNLFGFIEK